MHLYMYASHTHTYPLYVICPELGMKPIKLDDGTMEDENPSAPFIAISCETDCPLARVKAGQTETHSPTHELTPDP